ncbi:MAG TPA: hypothetical protein PK228_01425 [Saprospiraceae bacterium]|nr:hypothetical protein [Saprospiraceae bacterium]
MRIEIYSLADFKKADRLDRIRMHMVEPERFVLDDDAWQYAKDLESAWLLVSGETRESVSIRLIQNHVPGAESWYRANRMLRDIEQLYAPFLSRNRDMQRRRVVEKMYAMAEIAEKKAFGTDDEGKEWADKEWMVIAQKMYKDAAELEGLHTDNAPAIDPDDLVIPEIEITSDPQAFLEAQTEDLEYEEDDYPDEEAGEDGED